MLPDLLTPRPRAVVGLWHDIAQERGAGMSWTHIGWGKLNGAIVKLGLVRRWMEGWMEDRRSQLMVTAAAF